MQIKKSKPTDFMKQRGILACTLPVHVHDIYVAGDWENIHDFLQDYPQYKPENFMKDKTQEQVKKDIENTFHKARIDEGNIINKEAKEVYDNWKKR